MIFVIYELIIHIILNKKVKHFKKLYDIFKILVDFLCATRFHTGSVSWFHEVDSDPQH